MFNISLLCPTRNRPAGLERMWMSALETADNPEALELVLYLDKDDTTSIYKAKEIPVKKYGQINTTIEGETKEIYSNLHTLQKATHLSSIIHHLNKTIAFEQLPQAMYRHRTGCNRHFHNKQARIKNSYTAQEKGVSQS